MRYFPTTTAAAAAIVSNVFEQIQAKRETLRTIGLTIQSESTCDVVEDTYAFLYRNHMLDAYVRNHIISSYPSL